jgi:hypothetical protein
MLLKKATGGCTVLGYTWEKDGDVVEVPEDVAAELLSIRGGGFEAVEADSKPKAVREPGPKAEITEPAPKPAAPVTEAKPAK